MGQHLVPACPRQPSYPCSLHNKVLWTCFQAGDHISKSGFLGGRLRGGWGGGGLLSTAAPTPQSFRRTPPDPIHPCPHVSSSVEPQRAMNCFPPCCDSSSSTFFFPRYRLRALTRGLRRHQLQLFGDVRLRTLALPALLHAPVFLQHVATDDDDDGALAFLPPPPHHHWWCSPSHRPLFSPSSKL